MREVITSRSNNSVKNMHRLLRDSKFRAECREFAAEGEVMLGEAIRSGMNITTLFYDAERGFKDKNILDRLSSDARIIETNKNVIDSISSVEAPQGIIFSCKYKENADIHINGGGIIVLDSLSDPGNMGTILRTADAFSISDIILCGSCADIYNPKTVRASMGAVFRVNAVSMEYGELGRFLDKNHIKLYSACLSGRTESIRDVILRGSAVAIGSEAHGVSDEIINLSEKCVIIPMDGAAESLNAAVAAGIIMWEMSCL